MTNYRTENHSAQFADRAFTLIELMVAVVVIALLAGILLTAIPMIRRQAGKISAVNGLRQIAVASSCYGQDSKGTLPGPLYSWVTLDYTDNNYNGGLGATLWSYLNCPIPPKGWIVNGTVPASLDCLRDKYRESLGYPTQWHRWWYFYPSGIKSDPTGKFDPNGSKSSGTNEFWPSKLTRLTNCSDAVFLQDYAIDYIYNTPGTGYPLYGVYLSLYWDSHVGYLNTQVNAMTRWW
jgi:prepilin-type N-terminal cleavage/methylation domain-containing protein